MKSLVLTTLKNTNWPLVVTAIILMIFANYCRLISNAAVLPEREGYKTANFIGAIPHGHSTLVGDLVMIYLYSVPDSHLVMIEWTKSDWERWKRNDKNYPKFGQATYYYPMADTNHMW